MNIYSLAYHTASPEVIHRPLHGGIAVYTKIPNSTARFVGTLSGVVIDKSTKKKYLLSNQHVFFPYQSKSKDIKPGLSVYSPDSSTVAIAKTVRTKAESNPWPTADKDKALKTIGTYHDSAIAEPKFPVSMEVNNIGRQKSMVEPKTGMRIKYFGRKSRLQRGVITKASVNVSVDVGGGRTSVEKNIIWSDIKSAPGDSGSMIFTEDNHVVGLLFATQGDPNGGGKTVTAICRASAIAKAYNVAFSEEEVGGGVKEPEPEPKPKPVPEPKPIDRIIPEIKLEIPEFVQKNPVLVGAALGLGLITVIVVSATQK